MAGKDKVSKWILKGKKVMEMVRTLQRRFVVVAMVAVTILLVVLLGTINAINVFSNQDRLQQLLEILITAETTDAKLPDHMKEKKHRNPEFLQPSIESRRAAAAYFTARWNPEEELVDLDLTHSSKLEQDKASALVRKAAASGNDSGRYGNFIYRSAQTNDGQGMVFVFLDITVERYDILHMVVLCLLAGVVCWGLMLALVVILSRRAIVPIVRNMEKQQRFVTDAGHEIKTPLAIIQANTDALELHMGSNRWSKNIRQQTRRLDGLMQNLLTLVQLDESKSLQMQQVDLTQVVQQVLDMFADSLELRQVQLTAELTPNVLIQANREQMVRLVSILFDNVVKYGNTGGQVKVTLTAGKGVVLQVENTCDQLPQCPAEQLFDRFYRADAARTQSSGGYGIGLSAASAIVKVHKGTIEAQYVGASRIVFTVKLG